MPCIEMLEVTYLYEYLLTCVISELRMQVSCEPQHTPNNRYFTSHSLNKHAIINCKSSKKDLRRYCTTYIEIL
jgi:hypothetical protein